MEIYSFYQTLKSSMMLTDDTTVIIVTTAMVLAIWITLFVLQSIGIYTMATKQGLKNRILAFIPLVNILYIGKLAGECHFFNHRLKRAGMYAMIAQILVALVAALTIAAEQYLWYRHGAPQVEMEFGYYYWTGLSGFDLFVSKFFDVSGYVLPIFQLAFEIFLVVVMMGLCKKYSPKNHMLLSMVVLFIPMSRFIIIFVLRKREAIDYNAYMRARHEAYMRSQQRYYTSQNPYGNPYANPYGNPYARPNPPYGQQNDEGKTAQKPEEPFEEFSSEGKSKDGGEPFEEMRGGDDFFS